MEWKALCVREGEDEALFIFRYTVIHNIAHVFSQSEIEIKKES